MTPRERYAFRRHNGQCVTCGLVAARKLPSLGSDKPRFKARCKRCAGRLARTYRRESPARRAKRRSNDRAWQAAASRARAAAASRAARVRRKQREVCVDCRRAPAPDRIRCPRHLRLARDRQRKRRAGAQKNGL